MPITGRLTTAGRITLCSNYPQEFHDDLNFEEVGGIVLEMDDADLRLACGKFLGQRVAIWSADECADLRGTSAMEPTPENMQHLAARLAATEDHLTREVRSNGAAAAVRVHIEQRLKQASDDLQHAERLNDENGLPTLAELADLEAQVSELATMAGRMAEINKGLAAENDRLATKLSDALSRLERLSESERIAAEMAPTFSDVTHCVSSD